MRRWLPLMLIFALLIGFRVLGSAFPETLPNFQPLAALFFCGALLARGWKGFAIPLGAWVLTYPLPGYFQGWAWELPVFFATLAAFAATFFLGRWLNPRNAATLLLGSLSAALLFHLITNGAAWLGDPRYAKSLSGLWQSMWSGLPGDTIPSWIFLRNLTAANLLFTGIFALARVPVDSPAAALPDKTCHPPRPIS